LTALVFLLSVALIYVMRTILVLFAFSILFAYLINPAVRVLQRHSLFFKDLKGPHIFQAYLGFLILLALLVHAFAPDFRSRPGALGNLPAFADSVASAEIANNFGKNLGWTDSQTLRLKTFLQGHRSDIQSAGQAIQRSAVAVAGGVLVIPILAIFFLSDGEKLVNRVVLLVPPTSDQDAVRSLVVDLNLMLQRYIRAKVILGLLSFLFSSAALLSRARGARGNAGIYSHCRMDDGRNNHNGFRSYYALALDLDAGFARNLASRHGLRHFTASHGASTGDSSVARHIYRHGGGSGGRNRRSLSFHSARRHAPSRLA
jgi:hypothetical protein